MLVLIEGTGSLCLQLDRPWTDAVGLILILAGLIWYATSRLAGYGPSTTCYNRFVRWRRAGVWDRLLAAVSARYNGELVMIDSTCMRVHQNGATGKKGEAAIVSSNSAASQPATTKTRPTSSPPSSSSAFASGAPRNESTR